MLIEDFPEELRPREKLLQRGAASLSDAELLAVILRNGRRDCSAVELAQRLLNQFGGLHKILHADWVDLQQVVGIGVAKYAQLAVIAVIAERAMEKRIAVEPLLDNPASVMSYLATKLRHKQHEVFACILLDVRLNLLHYEELFRGSLSGTNVYPREVVKLVLKMNASSIIFAHNHPSGDTRPSNADKQITERLQQALGLIDVIVIDHIIVGEDTYSMAEHGLL
ncbi:MAG: DNA repair protein RadC [Proteobacteria bacterium]|jgi:DNA repair protein RadC|nr:DNA repair protein RadC [Pseudomonadota bacterium]